MARKDNNGDLYKHTLNLYAGDYAKIQDLFPNVGAGAVIRRIVREFVEKVEAGAKSSVVNTEVKL